MEADARYEHALSAALVILEEIDRAPDMPKHDRMALAVYSILHAMRGYDEERSEWRVEFSAN